MVRERRASVCGIAVAAVLVMSASQSPALAAPADQDVEVRVAAVAAHAAAPNEHSVAFLRQEAGDESRVVRAKVAWAIGQIGKQDGVPVLMGLGKDADPEVRKAVIDACGVMRAGQARRLLPQLVLSDPDSTVRCHGAKWLSNPHQPDGRPTLIRLVHDQDASVRAEAVRALETAGGEYTVAVYALTDPDSCVWLAADHLLVNAKYTDEERIAAERWLIQVLASPVQENRMRAASVLRAITGQDYGVNGDQWLAWWQTAHATWLETHPDPNPPLSAGYCR